MKKLAAIIALSATFATPVWAAVKTVTLYVPGMTCPACPITVREALSKVKGVRDVRVEYAKREAVVTFDNAKTNADALRQATANAGYPSKLER